MPSLFGRKLSFWMFCAGFLSVLLAPAYVFAAEAGHPNVLLVTIDTLRADHLSCYGYHLRTTPRLDRLAQEGIRFERAYTVVPLTGPSHVSLFTARYPQEHGAKVNGQPLADDPRLVTLAQILQKQGYQTAAFVSAWPLKESLTHLGRGFEFYDQQFTRKYQLFNSYRSAEDVTPLAIRWIQEAHKDPFFLWVHYFDPHKPYHLREEFADLESNPHGSTHPVAPDEETRDRIRRYDSEIAYTDHHLGKLLDELARLGIADSTVVVVVADHGESLGEHEYVGHGRQLYEGIVRVPLIIRYPPAVPAGKVVPQNVSLLDVMPTILDFVGVDFPLPLRGKTLRPLFEDPSRKQRDLTYFLTFPGKKWQAPKWLSWIWYHDSRDRLPLKMGSLREQQKMIWTPGNNKVEVFDLGNDSTETQPIYSGKLNGAYRTQVNHLLGWFEATTIYRKDQPRIKKKDIEVLRSLGYIGD